MNNTDKLKPIMRCGAGCGTEHDCAFPDCVDVEATLETLKAREDEIESLKSISIELQLQLEQEREIQKRSGLMLSAALRGEKRSYEPESSGRLDAVRAMGKQIERLKGDIDYIKNIPEFKEAMKAKGKAIEEALGHKFVHSNGGSDE